jgi:hypothetical protein
VKRKAEPTIEELFLDGRRIDEAMRRAVREALLRHRQAGVAIAVWRAGKVVSIAPDQIKIGRAGAKKPGGSRSSRAGGRSRASR